MQTFSLFAIVATFRDFSERVVGLVNEREGAIGEARRLAMARCPARYIRTRVRPVCLTEAEVGSIVNDWGIEDGSIGADKDRAKALPEPYRSIYLEAYRTAIA